MKVLHILEATQGGTRRHVLDLLPALQSRGTKCELVYSPVRYPAFRDDALALEENGIRTCEVAMARGWGGAVDARALRELAGLLRRSQPDIVHCHSTKAGLLGRLAVQSTSRRVPVVYTPHCLAFDTGLPLRQRRLARYLEKGLAPFTAHFIAVSQHEALAMRRVRLASSQRMSTIHNGVNLQEFDAVHPLVPDKKYFTVGCFGRLSAQKNQKVLLHALALLRQTLPAARLLLVGGGEDEAALRSLARKINLDDAVCFVGEQPEPRPLYFACDVLVQPSRWESCPYSVLEAMAARRPLVAAAVGGVPELLGANGEAGVLCKPCSPPAVASIVQQLAADADCRQAMGESARQRVEEYFRLETMVEQTQAVYEKVL